MAEKRSPRSQRPRSQGLLDHGKHALEAAPAGGAFVHLKTGEFLRQRSLAAGGREKQPVQVAPAQRIAERRREAGLRHALCHIGADRGGFGEPGPAIAQRRHLHHRVDGAEGRHSLLARMDIHQHPLIGAARFLQHPKGAEGACLRRLIERHSLIVRHARALTFVPRPLTL